MTVVIIDYGMGNLRSVQKAFEKPDFVRLKQEFEVLMQKLVLKTSAVNEVVISS